MKMSREIKFRAWLKEEKKMVNVEIIDFSEKSIQYLEKNEIIDAYLLRTKFLEDVELMQYTGLDDKNRIEIYEGDILKYKFPYDRRLKHVSLVKFIETEASFGLKDIYGNEIPLYRITANNYFEVIGNIYENKNLLEE
nr:MAG TPA: YopX protein [Caudoviricetes sp.]